MNTAINLANGTYSWFINAGDDIVSRKLSKLIEILKFLKDLNCFSVIIQDKNGEKKNLNLFINTMRNYYLKFRN